MAAARPYIQSAPPPARRHGRARRLLIVGAALALVGVAFGVVLPRIANYGDVWRVAGHLSWRWLLPLLAATTANIATFGLPWMTVLPGLGFVDAIAFTQASTALTLIVPGGAPVGMAASFAMLRSRGFDGAQNARAVALTGIWNQLSTFLFPVIGALAVAAEGKGGSGLLIAAILGGVLFLLGAGAFATAVASPRATGWAHTAVSAVASLASRLRGRGPVRWQSEDFERFRSSTAGLLRERWGALTLTTLANQLTGFLVLDLSLRAAGIPLHSISVVDSFAAWALARLLASLPLTPGGIGLVELGLTGLLIGFGGNAATVVAAVLLYRALSIVPTLLVGLAATLTWSNRSGSGAEPAADPGGSAAKP